MSDVNTGWRKRQIALDIMAENARELGLDYEPSKTVMEMAREADPKANLSEPYCINPETMAWLEAFAALVRADERERIEKVWDRLYGWRESDDETETRGQV